MRVVFDQVSITIFKQFIFTLLIRMQETREEHQKAIFISPHSIKPIENSDFFAHLAQTKKTFSKKSYYDTIDTTNPQQHLYKITESIVEHSKNPHEESYLEQFQEIIQKMPKQLSQQISNFTDSSFSQNNREDLSPSYFMEKQKMLCHTNWLSELQLRCVVEVDRDRFKTVCRIKDAELQFQNGLAFRLTKITKMKVMFSQYQKCLIITYDDIRVKKVAETKLRIFLEDDVKDDLFVFFSKIIVEKLMLNDYFVDINEGQDLQCDKFIMKGWLFKKGQVMDSWNERYMILTDRIDSYKNDKCTFVIKNIKQIWTRFEMVNSQLIVKIRHGKEKTELALPVVNYPVKFCKNNWLYRIYRLLSS